LSSTNIHQEADVSQAASVVVTGETLGELSPLIFGADVESVGQAVNGGIWDPNERRLQTDVLEAARALAPTLLRFPGSISCSSYDWRDGVGEHRKAYERTAWAGLAQTFADGGWFPGHMTAEEYVARVGGPDPNTFGTDEFLRFCIEVGAEPLLAANHLLDPSVAADWVRYTNRREESPRRVTWWTVAYEPWASYEEGAFTSGREYGEVFLRFVEAMRAVDPDIRFVAGGAPWPDFGDGLPPGSFLEPLAQRLLTWNQELAEVIVDHVEGISMHYTFPGALGRMIEDTDSDLLQVMTGGDAFGPMLDRTIGEIDAATGGRRFWLQLLEWGWQVDTEELLGTNHRLGDALLLAGCYNRMIERPDVVRLATMNHLVNALSSIQVRDGEVFTTALYLVIRLYREAIRRHSRVVEVSSETMQVPKLEKVERAMHLMEPTREARQAPIVDAAATADAGGLTVFVGNRSLTEPVVVTISGLDGDGEAEVRRLDGPSPFARNEPGAEVLRIVTETRAYRDGELGVTLPPATAAAVLTGAVDIG
jgi:alpha-N-arabinofuranosidase